MASSEEPPLKKCATESSINFKLCLLCQGDKFTKVGGVHKPDCLQQPEFQSYQPLLNCINNRAQYQNLEYVRLQQQLSGISGEELNKQPALWHKSCYSKATHKQHIERDKARYDKAISSQGSSALSYSKVGGRPHTFQTAITPNQASSASTHTLTRSRYPLFDKEQCFYCQTENISGDKIEHLVNCRSNNVGVLMQEIVDTSGNEHWRVNLANIITSGDVLSRDIKYHKSCHTTNWRKYKQSKERVGNREPFAAADNTVEFISAEIEFIAELQESLDEGSILTLVEVGTRYNDMMRDHGITNQQITRTVLLTKIEKQISNFKITEAEGKKPAVIHSNETVRSAIDAAVEERDVRQDMKVIFRCSKLIRQSILLARKLNPWTFTGSLTDCEKQCVPAELTNMMRWIVHGAEAATTDTRAKELSNTCHILSHSIVQSCKTKRQMSLIPKSTASQFRTSFDSPYSVGLSLYVYHSFRSQRAIALLNHAGVGITYDRVQKICNSIAISVCDNMAKYGVYVPPGLLKNKTIRASMDNIDKKVDTPDGKHSFHGMAIGVYQLSCDGETIVNQLQLNNRQSLSESLKNVPQTVIQLVPCAIKGSPKPQASPHYTSYKIGKYDDVYNSAQVNDLAWLTARYCSRVNSSANTNLSGPDSEVPYFFNSSNLEPDESKEITDEPEELVADKSLESQQVHLWAAYNSLAHTPDDQNDLPVIDKTFSLPIINAAATEWPTLVTALDQLTKLNAVVCGGNSTVAVTLDMDLYKRVVKLEYLNPQFKNKWVFSPGAFHTVICALRCLGRTIEGSGLDNAWQEADLYSSVTVSQILNGNHYNRAIEAHQLTLQALFDLFLEKFLEDHLVVHEALVASVKQLNEACRNKIGVAEAHKALLMVIESLNLEKQLREFDAAHKTEPMYTWTRMYMRQVMTMLQFQRAIREGNWHLYLASLEHLCKYFFAYSRLDYAQNIPEFVARMDAFESTDPELWQSFCNGEFVVNTSNHIPFTRIGVDQAMEHLNKATKGQGGISGLTTYPTTLMKFCLTAPELARIAEETERLVATTCTTSTKQHHQLSQPKITRQERSIAQLKAVLAPCNLFQTVAASENLDSKRCMFQLMSKEIIPDEVQQSILTTEETGMEAYKKFVEERIIGNVNLWDKMTKVKQKTWTSAAKEIKLNIGSDVLTLKATTSLFARLLVIARSSRDSVNLEEVIGIHEFAYTNKFLMAPDGSIHATTDKSTVIKLLQDMVENDTAPAPTLNTGFAEGFETCLVVDGMAVVQELMAVKNFCTCKELATSFVKLIDSKAREYCQMRIIFDNYTKTASMKEQTRERRKGMVKGNKSYIVQDSTAIKDKKIFLASSSTKDSLTLYLSDQLIRYSTAKVMTATRQAVMTNYDCETMPCVSTQEEADTLMIYHAIEVAKNGMKVHIYSQDTDVLLLAIRRAPLLGDRSALVMGTSERRRKVLLQPIYDKLGPEKAAAIINWHALTGCDTTGHIYGKGKKGCFATFLTASPEVLRALACLGEGDQPSAEVMCGCEEYLCSLFCPRGVHIGQAQTLRWLLFKRLKDDEAVDKLPPTQGAWIEHIRRAHVQANIWHQDMVLNPTCLDPLTLGWRNLDNKLLPVLSQVAVAPVSVLQLVRCNCEKSKCSRTCSCRGNNVVCTELCKCGGEGEICMNITPPMIGKDLEDD